MSLLTRTKALVLDTWSNLRYKRAFDNPHRDASSWVGPLDLNRLTAYRILAAYRENSAREYLPRNDKAQREHREYGDAELIVHVVVAGVLGDDMQITVDGADDDPSDTPTLPSRPEPPVDASDVEQAAFDAALRVWEERASEAVTAWEETWAALPGLRERQEWLRAWADSELFEQAVWEAESDVVTLGDGVYTLEVSTEEQRVKLDVYDPGFYFPVLDEAAQARGFPTTVHIAFDLDLDGDGAADHVRRITYELGFIQPLTVMTPDGPMAAVSETVNDPDIGDFETTRPINPGEVPSLQQGDRRRADGHIVRTYPWQEVGEESILTCYKTDATWRLRDVAGKTVYEFPLDPRYAMYATNETFDPIRRLDLRHDFLPVVHEPNTPSRRDHFGKSTLARVLQLLDDLAETDSDIQRAAALAGSPMVALSGDAVAGEITIRPGAVFNVGPNGRMDSVDLSAPLKALLKVKGDLEDRLGVNAQVPGEVTGRVEDTGAESGFARSLKLGPFTSLINLLRLVREPKYRLLLKFVQRMSQSAGWLPPGPTPTARLAFGSFLPSDRKQAIEEVVALLGAKGVSRRTALQLLVDVGIDIGDLTEELQRIDAEDVEAARELFEATGDQDLVNARLGLPPAATPEEPPVEPTPVPALPEVP